MPENRLNREIAYADTYGTATCSVLGLQFYTDMNIVLKTSNAYAQGKVSSRKRLRFALTGFYFKNWENMIS